jgi:amino-acid N-acetyltransferase
MGTVAREEILPRPPLSAAVALLTSVALPSSDLLPAQMEHFFYCGSATAPTGLVGVELRGPDALLRSLVVRPEARATGWGTALVERAEAYAREHGARSMFLLTTTAESFFRRRAYVAADRQSAPAAIRSTSEFAHLCPSSSALMVKRLVI